MLPQTASPLLVLLASLVVSSGCCVLHPQLIQPQYCNLPSDLNQPDDLQIERGKCRPLIDGFGWVWGIPSKITLWNRKVENHRISIKTESTIAEYLQVNQLDEIKVRINQYRPLDDWRRLTRNKGVAWPWRYTFGTVAVLGETVFPGRLFGGDHYNPYTGTIHLFSDVPAVALHEAAHAKDFARRTYPGTYAAVYALPGVPLWHERIASNDVLAYAELQEDANLQIEAYKVLYPAYGTYVGSAMGYVAPSISTPLYIGGVLTGHAAGRWRATQVGPPVETLTQATPAPQ